MPSSSSHVIALSVAFIGLALASSASITVAAHAQIPECSRELPTAGVTSDPQDVLSLTVMPERGVYETGEPVEFTITITDATDGPVTIRTHAGIYDLTVMAVGGGSGFRRPVQLGDLYCTFQPGQIVDLPYTATTQLAPAVYIVTASIPNGPEASTTFTVVPGGRKEQQILFPGCNNLTITWPDGTLPEVIDAAITPRGQLLALWRYDARQARFLAWSPLPGAPNDLETLNRLDAVYICMREPGTLTRPVI